MKIRKTNDQDLTHAGCTREQPDDARSLQIGVLSLQSDGDKELTARCFFAKRGEETASRRAITRNPFGIGTFARACEDFAPRPFAGNRSRILHPYGRPSHRRRPFRRYSLGRYSRSMTWKRLAKSPVRDYEIALPPSCGVFNLVYYRSGSGARARLYRHKLYRQFFAPANRGERTRHPCETRAHGASPPLSGREVLLSSSRARNIREIDPRR